MPRTSHSEPPPFFTRYGFTRTGDSEAPLVVAPYPEICEHGALRATVVASAVDLVGGFFTREVAGVDATFTSDLSLRIPVPGQPPRLLARGEALRTGQRLVTTGVTLHADEQLYAYGETTFTRIARRPEDVPDGVQLATPLEIPQHPLDVPLDDAVGIELMDPVKGHVRLPFRPALRNPEGVMQGALVALVVECAALARAGAGAASPFVVNALDLRYLAAASRGPVESRARFLGPPEAGMLSVELRDRGHDNRLTTTALVRVTQAPHA